MCSSGGRLFPKQIPQDNARFKIVLQKDKTIGSIAMVLRIYREHGLKTLYRGLLPCLIRDTFGSALYYGIYDTLIPHFKDERGRVNLLGSLASGGFCGLVYWVGMFPADYVKTLMQTDSVANPKYKGMIDCVRISWNKGGVGAFYTGVGLVALRAICTNGIGFASFELAKMIVY